MDLKNVIITKRGEFGDIGLKKTTYQKIYFPKHEQPLVSIIVPVFNNYKYTKSCLYYLYKHTENIDYEIILADDNSTDETSRIAEEFVNINIIKNSERLGFLKNVNNAVKSARGKYLCILHNDVIPKMNWLNTLLETIENNQDIGLVTPKVISQEGQVLEEGLIVTKLGYLIKLNFHGASNKDFAQNIKEVNCGSDCAILIRKTDWEKAGGLDTDFSHNVFCEYADLSFTFKYKLGLKIVYQPKSEIVHLNGKSYTKFYDCNNRLIFYHKWKKEIDELAKQQDNTEKREGTNINICFGVTDNYSQHAGCTIASILLNASKEDKYNFYIMSDYINPKNKQYFEDLKKIKDCNIIHIEMNHSDFESIRLGSLGYATMYRIKIFDFIKDEKALYLDSDMIVCDDLSEFYNTDISNYLCAGVEDTVAPGYKKKWNMHKNSTYINAGAILFNIQKCKEENIDKKFMEFAISEEQKIKNYNDQDIVNIICQTKIKLVNLRWNVMYSYSNSYDNTEYENAAKNPGILHYITQNKPWVKNSNPYKKDEYFQYLRFTPWYDEFIKDYRV